MLISGLPVEDGNRRDESVFSHKEGDRGMQRMEGKRGEKAKRCRLIDGVLNERTDAQMQIGFSLNMITENIQLI